MENQENMNQAQQPETAQPVETPVAPAETTETAAPKTEGAHNRKKGPSKKRMALTFCIGLAFISLVVWGVWSLGSWTVGHFRAGQVYSEGVTTESIAAAATLHDQLAEVEPDSKEYFRILLANFVMQDVPPFAHVDDLDSEYIVSYGLWQTITLNNSQGILAPGENGGYRIPKKLVEKLATYYVEYTDSIKHQNVSICGDFKYNSLNRTYSVPASYPTDYLIPKVVNVELNEENNTAEVTVDCYQYNDVDEDPTAKEVNFRKREIYTLKKMGNTAVNEASIEAVRYTIVSMKQAEKTTENNEKD
ncbi:MAG: hypothetical protein IJN42_00395 [Clostridia bacterium]|nr:hypothetical protein [Clostridia bacterium]